MKHTLDELLAIVYRYYSRGVGITDIDIQARIATEEHSRLVAARRQAAAGERCHAMLRRIADRFPGMLENHSPHLAASASISATRRTRCETLRCKSRSSFVRPREAPPFP
jgi:hypothetical protein